MTLGEMKQKAYTLIEEYSEDAEELTEDEDLALKMNNVINQIQNELARIKRLPAYSTITGEKGNIIDLNTQLEDFYQLDHVNGCNVDVFGTQIEFNEDGELKAYYYKYPTQITEETENEFEFDLPTDVLEIMPIGIAGTLLMSDVSNQYGQNYLTRYEQLKQTLDPRYTLPQIYIDDDGMEI
jgi:hypothetical protein